MKKTLIILILSIFILTGCSSEKENSKTQELQSKIVSELDYLDKELFDIANVLNNISTQNYIVTTSEATMPESTNQETESGNMNNSQGKGSDEDKKLIISEMTINNILIKNNTEIDWDNVKKIVEDLYNIWNTIILDLNQLNIPSDKLLEFSSNLNIVTQYVKNEDKEKTLSSISNLYMYIPFFLEYASKDTVDINLKYTKRYVLSSYSYVETEEWGKVNSELDTAIDKFSLIRNSNSKNVHSIDKIYIILNSLKSATELKDKEIYYINYRNLILELNIV